MATRKTTRNADAGNGTERKEGIRLLFADEIECRVGTQRADGCSLLLYKDARVDMRLLDEHFGPMNWKRDYSLINGNLFCTISIWDEDKKEWISKQDVGTESNTEKEKGQASDSFKRAGFNWGIGRELYTAPFIWIVLSKSDLGSNDKLKTKFMVKEIGYNEQREINRLVITDGKSVRYTYGDIGGKTKKPSVGIPDVDAVYTGSQIRQAVEEMKASSSRVQVNEIWIRYANMQNDKEFREACMEKCKQYPK